MDSLHVSGHHGQPMINSKHSSRSASPCHPRTVQEAILTTHNIHAIHDGKFPDIPNIMSNSGSVRGRQKSPTTHKKDRAATSEQDDQPATPQRISGHIDHASLGPEELLVADIEDAMEYHPASASFLSNGSGEMVTGTFDEPDSQTYSRIEAALHHLHNKITRTKELIRQEQTERDENVNEYLKLAANAANTPNTDKQQLGRIKAVFEKKNQKSAHVIAQLQKKLESYSKRVRDLELAGETGQLNSAARQPRAVLRDMGQGLKNVGGNIRDGITGFSGSVMSKPREFAHLIKNKFGSADNINQLSTWYIGGSSGENSAAGGGANSGTIHHGSATLPAGVAATGGSHTGSHSHSANKFPSEEGSECSSVTSESMPGCNSGSGNHAEGNTGSRPAGDAFSLKPIFNELQERREEYERLRERIDSFKNLQSEVQFLNSALQEERFRSERLEEQINDLTELHQNEVENLKQALADMEEKVQYQSEERLRDIHEMLEHCQTKIQKMEHQALQQQQYVTLEGLDNSNARALVVKLINIVLTVLQVILLLVATTAGITMPFLRTRVRILTTILLVCTTVFVLKQWPEVRDIGSHVMRNLKETLDAK